MPCGSAPMQLFITVSTLLM